MSEAASGSREVEPDEIGLALRKRIRRLQLKRVNPPVLAWIIVCWVLTAAALVVLFSGALSQVVPEPGADGLVGFSAPLWYRLFITISGAVIAGAVIVVHGTPRPDGDNPTLRSSIEEGMIAIGLLVPVLVLIADRAWPLAIVAILAAVAVEVVIHRTHLRIVPGLLTAVVWLTLTAHALTPAGEDATSWTWIVLPGLGAAVAAFGAYYGVARAAEQRSRAIRVLFRERWNPIGVLVAVLVAVVVVVLRLTVARELFPVPDPALWFPWSRHWSSWVLAALVVGVLVVVSIRSTRRPLRRVGQRRLTLGFALLGNLHLFAAGLVIVIGLILAVVGSGRRAAELRHRWCRGSRSAASPCSGCSCCCPRSRAPRRDGSASWRRCSSSRTRSRARSPACSARASCRCSRRVPVQVLLLLVAVAVVLAIVNLVRPTVRGSLVVRFAVVPIIAVHAGWLLPAVWSQFGLILGAILLVLGLLLMQRPPARDNATHSARSLVNATTQLFGFGIALLAAPSLLDDPSIIVLGLIWLSVVVVAALCIETVAREPEEECDGAPRSRRTRTRRERGS